MTPAEALRDVRGYAAANRIDYSGHARLKMRQRNIRQGDVEHALAYAAACRPDSEPDLWAVTGPDLDGDALRVIVDIDDGLFVVTVHGE